MPCRIHSEVIDEEQDRQSRMQTREQRLREREVRRILHEEELAKLEELKAKGEDEESRHSSRHIKNEVERRQRELDVLKEQEEEDKWVFDCSGCGLHGENVDDGTHSVACEKCNIWQHSKCNGIKEADAEREDFHFVCSDCKRKAEDAKKPRISLKLGRTSSSPKTEKTERNSGYAHVNGGVAMDGSGKEVNGSANATSSPSSTTQPPVLAPAHHPPGSAGRPQQPWPGDPLLPRQQPSPNSHHQQATNGSSPYYQSHHHLHQNAHANAVAAAGFHQAQIHQHPQPYTNGWPPRAQPQFQPPASHRPAPLPQSSFMNTFSAGRPSAAPSANEAQGSPMKQRQQSNPADRAASFTAIGAHQPSSPQHALSPPPLNPEEQRRAGKSPTKQASPSPQAPNRTQTPMIHSSPSMALTAATPAQQVARAVPSPASSFFQASPNAQASPIPPVGNGPVIPQKHDPIRPPSRDHATETPVYPPATNLSPSRLPDGKGLGVHAGQGGLGTGQIPVKKLPGEDSSPVQPPAAAQVVQQMQLSPSLGHSEKSNGHIGNGEQ